MTRDDETKAPPARGADAFLRGLGALASFAHPPPRSLAGSKSNKVARALGADWDRLGADFRKVADRERSTG